MQNTTGMFATDTRAVVSCRMGAQKEAGGIRFTLYAPESEQVALVLYNKKDDEPVCELAFAKNSGMGGVRTLKVLGLPWREYLYRYRIGDTLICDPYAKMICGGYSGMDFSVYDWKDAACPQISYEDAVMYHLHVRNFTIHPKSGVPHKGTFRGLQEKIPYLKSLGINQVKLMPVYPHEVKTEVTQEKKDNAYALEKEPRHDYWGYAKGAYFALNEAYCSSGDPAKEFKNMVRAFHENGMEVLLDFYFPQEVPVRMILDCLTFWAQEYRVDGFHLFGREDAFEWLNGDAQLSACKLIVSGIDENRICRGARFAQCNDGFLTEARKLLKGDEGVLESFAYRARRNPAHHAIVNYIVNHDGFTLQDLVSYDTKHNEENGEQNRDGAEYNFSWNCGVEGESRKKSILALRKKQMRNAVLMLVLSQGVPMLMSGDEFGNSQQGNNNPYCLDNPTSWVDWGACRRNAKLTEFVRQALAFRAAHKILHMENELQMNDYKSCGYPDLSYHSGRAWYGGFEYHSRQLGMMYYGKYAGEDEFIYVAYNLNPLAQSLALPKLPADFRWHKAIDTSLEEAFAAEPQELAQEGKTMEFPARSITVLVGKKVQ